MLTSILIWIAEQLGWAWVMRKLSPTPINPVKEVEDEQTIENRNTVDLHDGDAQQLLRQRWQRPD